MNNAQFNVSIIISHKPFYDSDTVILSAIINENRLQSSMSLGYYRFQTALYIILDIIDWNNYGYVYFIHSIYW